MFKLVVGDKEFNVVASALPAISALCGDNCPWSTAAEAVEMPVG